MGLLAEARAYVPGRPRCTIGLAMAEMPDALRAEFNEAMADESIATSGIAAVSELKPYGIKMYALRRHRRGECACS